MKIKRIAVISLSNRDFDTFADKLAEACSWVQLAAKMGSDLAVLPEEMNNYCGDGPGNPRALTMEQMALDDWRTTCASLIDCAVRNRIAVTVPLITREPDGYRNGFFLVDRNGAVLGRYNKRRPTIGELDVGIVPGETFPPIPWEDGIRVGGGICFDLNFHDVFADQKKAGANLFLCPSLFPGGSQLNYFAQSLQTPIALAYPAWSRIIDTLGREIAGGGYRHEQLRFGFGVPVYTADINFDSAVFHFDLNQEKIDPILRRYGAAVRLAFDQENSRFALESLAPDLTIGEVAREFGLETMGDYLVRAEKCVQTIAARSRRA